MAFLNVPIRRGEIVRQRVPFAELSDGSQLALPVMTIGGSREGPTLFVQAGLHGDELTGIEICRRAISGLAPDELRGDVVVVPMANLPAFLTRTRGFLHEERWLVNINRIFPGSVAGLLTERIAQLLFEEFALHADYVLDLHSGLEGCNIAPLVYIDVDSDGDETTTQERLGLAFGTELLFYKPRSAKLGTSDMSRSMRNQAARAGKVMLSGEMGESRRVTQEFVPIGVRGVRNVMRALEMLPGQPDVPERRRRFTAILLVHANRGGGLRMKADLGQDVRRGQPLAEIVDVFGEIVEQLESPADGVLLRKMLLGSVNTGAEVAWIATGLADLPRTI